MVCYGFGVGRQDEEDVPRELMASRVREAALCVDILIGHCLATDETRIKHRPSGAWNQYWATGPDGGAQRWTVGGKMDRLFPFRDRLNPLWPG